MQKTTESDSNYDALEKMDTIDLLKNINREDKTVAHSVEGQIPKIEGLVNTIVSKIKLGGRLFYLGAGTSGRLGIVDASECPPTFGVSHDIVESIKKTNRLLVIDEDVPGGASAYILQQIIEEQDAYHLLDSEPQTLSAKEHRPPYGKDGDYFTKPSAEDVFEKVYAMMNEVNPKDFPSLY